MSDVTQTSKAPKSAKPKKPKKATNHPKYEEMIISAINELKERGGSSRQKILKYVMIHYDVGKETKVVNTHLKLALKRGVQTGVLKHPKGSGASGSFRLAVMSPAVEENVKVKKPKMVKTKSVSVKKVAMTPKKPKPKKVPIKAKIQKKKTPKKTSSKAPRAKSIPKPKKGKTPISSHQKKTKGVKKSKK